MPSKQTTKATRSPTAKQPGAGHPADPISLSPMWKQRLQELQAFKKEHGHCNVPTTYAPNQPLAHWVANVRSRKPVGMFAAELVRRLDELGFAWALRHRTVYRRDWDAMVAALAAFKDEHGHCCVPRHSKKYQALVLWLTDVRHRKKRGLLDRGRIQELERLGVMWDSKSQTWNAMIAALTAFKNQHGHLRVPRKPAEHRALANWLAGVRREKKAGLLDRKRIRQLNKLGIKWEPKSQEWQAMFADLVAYRAKHGDCNVPIYWSENPRLGSWVVWQRRARKLGIITEDHFQRLDKIGFVWSRAGEPWESKYAALVEYQQKHGHCRAHAIAKENASLGKWVRKMRYKRRRGKLSEERIRLLDALGFAWDMPGGRTENSSSTCMRGKLKRSRPQSS